MGKSTLMHRCLADLPDDMASHTIVMNYFSDAARLQRLIEDRVEKRCVPYTVRGATLFVSSTGDYMRAHRWINRSISCRSGKLYCPPGNKTLLVFLDDLNIPMADKYGTQSSSALLRLYLDHGGWYDRSDRSTFKELKSVRLLAAMTPAASPNVVDKRLLVRCC
jgi:hypothetical protein